MNRLINTLFPEEPAMRTPIEELLNPNDDADMSLEYYRQRALHSVEEAARITRENGKEFLHPTDEQVAQMAMRLRYDAVQEQKVEAKRKQDQWAKHKPLTEVEALWRIERAILRVAHALEGK